MRLKIRSEERADKVIGRGVEIWIDGVKQRDWTKAVLVIDVNDICRLYFAQVVGPSVDISGDIEVAALPEGFDPEAEVQR